MTYYDCIIFRYSHATDQEQLPHYGAAVAIMKGTGGVKGLARMVQVSESYHIYKPQMYPSPFPH